MVSLVNGLYSLKIKVQTPFMELGPLLQCQIANRFGFLSSEIALSRMTGRLFLQRQTRLVNGEHLCT